MKNVNALHLQGVGQLVDITELPDEQGSTAEILWESVNTLFKQTVRIKCAFNKAISYPHHLLKKASQVGQKVIVNFDAELMDIQSLFYGQTPECPKNMLSVFAQLNSLKVVGFVLGEQMEHAEKLAA